MRGSIYRIRWRFALGECVLAGYKDSGVVEIERPPYRTWGPFAWSHKLRRELILTVRNVETVAIEDGAKIAVRASTPCDMTRALPP